MRAFRRLAAAPFFLIFAVATLALGIGGTTALYAVAEAVLFRPSDIRDAGRVINIYHHDPSRVSAGHQVSLSSPDARDIEQAATTLAEVMFWSRIAVPLTEPDGFRTLQGELVSGNYFTFIGVNAILGRTLQPSDDEPGASAVVVIAESLWRSSFGGDPSVIGLTLHIGRQPFEIVGVMPASFRGVDMPTLVPTRVWAPLRLAERLGAIRSAVDRNDREHRWLLVKGRLRDGRTLEQARAEIEDIGRRLDSTYPIGSAVERPWGRPEDVRHFAVTRAADLHAHESVDPIAVPAARGVLVAVGLVLLVVCTNLANLLLARGTGRRHEVAVRRALGATRLQVIAALVSDSLLIALAGGTLGLAVAQGLITLLSTSLPLGAAGLDLAIEPRMTTAVLAVALSATASAALVFGLIPAWHATKGELRQVLDLQTGGAVARWRGRRLLIAAQVAVAAALLVPGTLLLQQTVSKQSRDPGFDLASLVATQIDYTMADLGLSPGVPEQAARSLRRTEMLVDATNRLARAPGVTSATLVSRLPLHFSATGITIVGREPAVGSDAGSADPTRRAGAYLTVGDESMFDTLGIKLLYGRGFDRAEVESHAPVIVIGRTLAVQLYGADVAVGRTLSIGGEPVEVVGVAADTDATSLGRRRIASIYRPGRPDTARPVVIAARAQADPDVVSSQLRAILRDVDTALPVVDVVTGRMIVDEQTRLDRISADLVTLLGSFALVLALSGLAGLLSYIVASRRREIGVRLALGADRRRIVRLVIADGLRPVLYGGAVGLAAGAGLSYLVGAYFYRLPGIDWIGVAAVTAVVLPAAALACYLPARRAASLEPNITLREL